MRHPDNREGMHPSANHFKKSSPARTANPAIKKDMPLSACMTRFQKGRRQSDALPP